MAGVKYMKGVRTRFSNKLKDEIQNGLKLLNSADSEIIPEDCARFRHSVMEAKLNINSYNEKLSSQSEKLAESIEDSEDQFVMQMIEEDSEIQEKACAVYHKLQLLEEKIKFELKDVDVVKREESASQLAVVTEEMQRMFSAQMDLQKELVRDKQFKKETVKLPKIDIPSFNGNKLYWIEFWDSFESAIHNNDRLSEVDKFNYLKSRLTGEARQAIIGLSLSKQNYTIAIQALHKRFGDRQETIDLHYKAMIDIFPARNSVEGLRQFLDKTEKHLRCLEVLGQDTNQEVFVSMIRRKLPNEVLLQLEIMKGVDRKWSVVNFRELLRQYIVAKEKAETTEKGKRDNKDSVRSNSGFGAARYPKYSMQRSSSSALFTSEKQGKTKKMSPKCRYCANSHWSDECLKFPTIDDRKKRIKGSCYRCLKEGHISSQCKTSKQCVYCGEVDVHHRSLCERKFKGGKNKESVHLTREIEPECSDSLIVSEEIGLLSCNESVVMQTAKCIAANPNKDKCDEIRLILDSGSHRTYITEDLARRLCLKEETEQEIHLVTFGSSKEKSIKTRSTRLKVKLKSGEYMTLIANIVPNITGSITRKRVNIDSPKQFSELTRNLSLADNIPNSAESVSLDLLLGNDYYLDIIQTEKIMVQPGLYLLSSSLGWILSGRMKNDNPANDKNDASMLILTYGNNITETKLFIGEDEVIPTKPNLEDFWNIESLGITDSYDKPDDETAMVHFKETLKFENDRYQVTWPWKEENPDLPENRGLAKGRLQSLLSKLRKQPELMQRYDEVIADQLEKGIIEKVEREQIDGIRHYIPHHVVITPEKSTTKLRIVYDASAKTRNEFKSLNECLYRGPVLLRDLCGILMRFRLHKIGLVSDIEKAFLQVDIDVNRFSSLSKLLRVTAWCVRFTKKLTGHVYKKLSLSSEELNEALNMWLCFSQRKYFGDVYQSITEKKPNNLARQFDLVIDERGLLRCGGRLEHAALCEAARRPLLLPRKDRFTHLMIKSVHRKLLHSGVSQTLSEIRHKFWIPKGRSTVTSVLKSCCVCKRVDCSPYKLPPMAPFPKARVSESTPFTHVGLDYLGPLYVKEGNNNNKIWICLFTCLSTRAVHLEVVPDMTAGAFLLCLRRFIATRGTPTEIISDNAKQFKLSSDTVRLIWGKMLQTDDVQNYVSEQAIKWSFIVELAPWMGGFYERLVGIVKQALRKSLGRKLLSNDQMNTLIKEVESVVNRRPLVYVGEDIKSSITLSPCHFLSLNPKTGIPELDPEPKDPDFKPKETAAEKLLKIWKKGEQLLNRFWALWRDEYLLSLRERSQRSIKSPRSQFQDSASVGDVVVIKDNLPRGQWKLGKIMKLYTSRDGKIRSAQLQVSSGQLLRRPLNLLYPIEVSASKDNKLTSQKLDRSTNFAQNDFQTVRPKRKAAVKARDIISKI